jgi:hypothetical protein
VSIPGISPDAELRPIANDSTQLGQPIDVTATPTMFYPVVDPIHHVAVVGSLIGDDVCNSFRGCPYNNNPMSSIAVVDLTTGRVIKKMSSFNFWSVVTPALGYDGYPTRRGIQLDPATRTGWTFGPDGRQLQQFSY